jgi:hypothetical protein
MMVFMAGMVGAVNEEASALRGAIQKAMTEAGCSQYGYCKSDDDCYGGFCVSCALLFRNPSMITNSIVCTFCLLLFLKSCEV